MTTDSSSVLQPKKSVASSSHKLSTPKAGPSSGPTPTYLMGPDGHFVVNEKLNCKIIVQKTPILKICSEHKISYRLLCQDYDILPDPNFKTLSDDESDIADSDDDQPIANGQIFKNLLNSPLKTRSKSKRKSKKSGHTVPKKCEKRKTIEDPRILKKTKLNFQSPAIDIPIPKPTINVGKKKATLPSASKVNKTKPGRPRLVATTADAPVIQNQFSKGFEEFVSKTYKQTSSSNSGAKNVSQSASNTKTNNKRTLPFKAKDRQQAKKRQNVINPNKCIFFLGELFREMDLFDDYCECVNDCQMDELSMAFDMLDRSKRDENLPRDLRYAIGSLVINDDDEYFDDVLPSETDVLHQVQQEAQQETQIDINEDLVDAFLLNAGLSLPNGFSTINSVPNGNAVPLCDTQTSTATHSTETVTDFPMTATDTTPVTTTVSRFVVTNGTLVK